MRDLLRTHPVTPDFFDDPARPFLVAGLSDRLLSAHAVADEVSWQVRFFLFRRFTPVLAAENEAYIRGTLGATGSDLDKLSSIYDAFTDPDTATADRLRAMLPELVDSARRALNASPLDPEHFEVRVLAISTSHTEAGSPLHANRKAFGEALGFDLPTSAVASVVETSPGHHLVMVPIELARAIVTGDDSSYPVAQAVETIVHEWTHTVGGVAVEGQHDLLLADEELRADLFRPASRGYPDVRLRAHALTVLTGLPTESWMLTQPLGGRGIDLLLARAERLGMPAAFELAALQPNSVLSMDPRKRALNGALGHTDGVMNRIVASRRAAGEAPQLLARVALDASGRDVAAYTAELRRFGGNTLATLVEDSSRLGPDTPRSLTWEGAWRVRADGARGAVTSPTPVHRQQPQRPKEARR